LSDNRRTRILNPDGTYSRASQADGQSAHRSQSELLSVAVVREEAIAAEENLPLSFDAISELPLTNGEPRRDGAKRKKKRSSARR
jgi:hypothetical protein